MLFAASLSQQRDSADETAWRDFIDTARTTGLRISPRDNNELDAQKLSKIISANISLAQQALRLWLRGYAGLRAHALHYLMNGQSFIVGGFPTMNDIKPQMLRLDNLAISAEFTRCYPQHDQSTVRVLAGMVPFLAQGVDRLRKQAHYRLVVEFQDLAATVDLGEPLPDVIDLEFLRGWIGEER